MPMMRSGPSKGPLEIKVSGKKLKFVNLAYLAFNVIPIVPHPTPTRIHERPTAVSRFGSRCSWILAELCKNTLGSFFWRFGIKHLKEYVHVVKNPTPYGSSPINNCIASLQDLVLSQSIEKDESAYQTDHRTTHFDLDCRLPGVSKPICLYVIDSRFTEHVVRVSRCRPSRGQRSREDQHLREQRAVELLGRPRGQMAFVPSDVDDFIAKGGLCYRSGVFGRLEDSV